MFQKKVMLMYGHRIRPACRSLQLSCSARVHQKSRLLPGPERIRVSNLIAEPSLLQTEHAEAGLTTYEIFQRGLKQSNNGPCIGTRNKITGQYEWISYQETWEQALNVGSAYQQFGLETGQKSLIGINVKNSAEFVLSHLGAMAYSSIFCPLYDNLNAKAVNHIITLTEISLFVVDSEAKANYIISQKALFPHFKVIVTTWQPSKKLVASGRAVNIDIISFSEFKKLGAEHRKAVVPPKPDDLLALCWTSGTSGLPKGVPITHRNIASTVNAGIVSIKSLDQIDPSVISYMPTGHAYELAVEYQVMSIGGKIGFFGGDILKLVDDIKALKPTFLPVVPRLLNRIHSMILQSVKNHPVKKRLLYLALNRKEKLLRKGIVTNTTLWDKIFLKKIQEALGGRVAVMMSSSAPLDGKIKMFFRCALGCYFFNGYGQTEVMAATITTLDDIDGDSVGAPLPGCLIKLADVPSMNYFAKDDIGEICIKGSNTVKGYYKNQEATAKTFLRDDWVHSGDIGRWLPDGTLQIVDRMNNLFKLSQGEFVSPDRVENVYLRHPLIAQIYVDGFSDKDYLVAIVIPEIEVFKNWAKDKGFRSQSVEELCCDVKVRTEVLKRLRKYGADAGLISLEQVKNIHIRPKLFSIEEGYLTPTLKLKRNIVKRDFLNLLQQLYQEESLIKNSK